jgi:uncharacterized membrane protein
MRLPTTISLCLMAVLSFACEDEDTEPSPPREAGVTADRAPDLAPDASADAGVAGFFPCDVEAVLKAKCHTCHTSPTKNGAPFPLLEYANTQMAHASGMKVFQVMKTAVETGFMPLAGSSTGPLTADEKTTLLGWLNAGAVPAAQRCPADAGS